MNKNTFRKICYNKDEIKSDCYKNYESSSKKTKEFFLKEMYFDHIMYRRLGKN